MPRYFITTIDGFEAHDDEGLVLAGPDALAKVLRQTLAAMLHDEGTEGGRNEFSAKAYDEDGRPVLTARVSMTTVAPT